MRKDVMRLYVNLKYEPKADQLHCISEEFGIDRKEVSSFDLETSEIW